MGHERVGFLPRSKRWRDIVSGIAEASISSEAAAELADRTLGNVASRFRTLQTDSGVQAAFGFLVALATAHLTPGHSESFPHLDLESNPSALRVAKKLKDWVDAHAESHEYAELASRAACDTIAEWTRSQSNQQHLFDDNTSASVIWSQAGNGADFCTLSRSFFSHFTDRYLRYFLEREASVSVASVEARDQFTRNLTAHIDTVARHAFETSKITQSFAAGWFNNHAREQRPSASEIRGFLALAFGKLHEELRREGEK